MAKKVVFIGGSSFSGSTMLDMMLSNSPDGFSAGEVTALFYPFRPHHFDPNCGCGDPDCDFWTQVRVAGESQLYRSIFTLLPEISFIVDSSKSPWWIEKQSQILKLQGYEVHHLLIWKEPAAFAHSMLKRKKRGWDKSWKNYYRLYLTLIHDYMTASYDELAQHPAEVLQRLCSKMGLIYHKEQEQFWKKQHHTLFGNDSAKIHLHGDSRNNIQHCNKALTRRELTSKHRTVYHDISYIDSLPNSIRSKIKTDSVIKNILQLLNSEDKLSSVEQTISFTPTQIFFAKMSWIIKSNIGRTLGRYWLIF